jgi:hypothetical protein
VVLGTVKVRLRASLLEMLIVHGFSHSLEALMKLDLQNKPLGGCSNVSLANTVEVKLKDGSNLSISLMDLALCTNNHKVVQCILQKSMDPKNTIVLVIDNLGRIIKANEIKAFSWILTDLISVRHETKPDLECVLAYIFSEKDCITDIELSKLCADAEEERKFNSRWTVYTAKIGNFTLFNQLRLHVQNNPTIKAIGKSLFLSLLDSHDNPALYWGSMYEMLAHSHSCQALGLSPSAESKEFFDLLTAVLTASSTSDANNFSTVLKHYALSVLIASDRLFQSEEAINRFLQQCDAMLSLQKDSGQRILNRIDVLLINRIRAALKRKPHPVDEALCLSWNRQNNLRIDLTRNFSPLESKKLNSTYAIKDPELSLSKQYCFVEGQFIQLPANEGENKDKLILGLITTLTYHATNVRAKDLGDLAEKHYKCHVILKVLPTLRPELRDFDLQQYYKEQYRLEAEVVKDYVGDDISEDSDEKLDSAPLNVFEERHYEAVVTEAGAKKLLEKDGKLKNILLFDEAGQPKWGDNGGLRYDKKKMKHDPLKRARKNGEINLESYPPEKFKKVKGAKLDTSDDIKRHVEAEIKRVNSQYNKGQERYYSNVSTPFFLHFTRGIHHDRLNWNADQRREHNKLQEDELKLAHYAPAVFEQKGLDCSAGALLDKDSARKELDPVANMIADNLKALRGSNGDLYNAVHELYSSNYDKFKAFLAKCKESPQEGPAEEKAIKDTCNQYFINQSNHFVSAAGTPYHALKYAYGLKTYPGHQEERLRPRWRKNGRAERPKSGKAYIYLLTLEEYTKLNPYNIPSEYDQGNSALVGVYRAERETSFFGKIPEGCIFMQHIAKYPSFNGPYKPIYLAKYGLSKQMYQIFGEAIKNSTPHSPENHNAKTILGEWLCAFHEVKILRELTARVINMGGVILYHDANGFSEHVPAVIDSRNEQKSALRMENPGQNKKKDLKKTIDKIMKEKAAKPTPPKRQKTDEDEGVVPQRPN